MGGTGHVSRSPVSIIGDWDLVAVGEGGGEKGEEGDMCEESRGSHCRELREKR